LPSGVATVISRMASTDFRYGSSQRTVRSKCFSPSYTLRDRLPADGRLDDRVDVARVEAVASARGAVGRDLHVGLPERRNMPRSSTPGLAT
jgi:hypothetical protein